MLALLLLEGILFADFLLDLLKSFKEELLNLTALIKHDLREGTNIAEVFVLYS